MKKTIISLLLVILTMVSGLEHSAQVAQAKEVNIDFTAKISSNFIETGKSVAIKTLGSANGKKLKEFVYSPDNKKVVSVSKTGVVNALAPGDCYIKVYPKGYEDYYNYVYVRVVDRIIKITGPSKYEAGKTYQLKASEKNVEWDLHNVDDEARASIDPNTGKIKIRSAGLIYIACSSKDGKAFGSTYITAKGPIIEEQIYRLEPIELNKDEHIVSYAELEASGKLPKTMTVPYTYGKKKGKVEVTLNWGQNIHRTFEKGDNTIYGSITAPEGYLAKGYYTGSSVELDVRVLTEQSDVRKKIISVEKVDPITINEDEHITDYWDVIEKYFSDKKLVCNLEDGSRVEFAVGGVGYTKYIGGKGTYICQLYPKYTVGYDTGDDERASTELIINIKKKQTYEKFINSLDTIGIGSIVIEYVTQEYLSK